MPNNTKTPTHKVTKEKRILNEIGTKVENEEKLDNVVEARAPGERSLHDIMPFDCECDDEACKETISMSTGEYKRVHQKSNSFVVLPSHVHLDIEKVVTSFSNYVTVAKLFGRADSRL